MTIETKNSIPASSEIVNWATVFGIVLALGILAMSVGLIRSETASDLRTLTATGASGWTRRTLTAVTAGALGLTGAVLGTAGGLRRRDRLFLRQQLDGLGELKVVPTCEPAHHPGRHAARRRGGRLAARRARAVDDRQAAGGVTRQPQA